MKDMSYYLRRVLFVVAFVLAALAVLERVINLFGYTLIREYYTPWRLLEFAAIGLLFLISLQLREINVTLTTKANKDKP